MAVMAGVLMLSSGVCVIVPCVLMMTAAAVMMLMRHRSTFRLLSELEYQAEVGAQTRRRES